ncbi:hypothetical protein GWI33_012995 [Rhynchophorus ferrugineus]|uniref:Uncharacterized protein n=1 Tax=Rhynchophorus ferrugineus TaxID=354439 RepID=A0A834I935_RHYFE|nr:hypothetical protein GWI33_012995 [Rhynchophorus ferrugineus]
MSKPKEITALNHSDVSRKIISKDEPTISPLELTDYSGKNRNENISEYSLKKEAFLQAVKQYKALNADTVIKKKVALHENYEDQLDLSFLKENNRLENDCQSLCCCLTSEPNVIGKLHRKRSIRPIHKVQEAIPDICLFEPWFQRYLTLNKFIWAARSIILKNRLVKVLNKLKSLTVSDIEKINDGAMMKKAVDFHCHPVFERFLY